MHALVSYDADFIEQGLEASLPITDIPTWHCFSKRLFMIIEMADTERDDRSVEPICISVTVVLVVYLHTSLSKAISLARDLVNFGHRRA
jgi:hypothetical protein